MLIISLVWLNDFWFWRCIPWGFCSEDIHSNLTPLLFVAGISLVWRVFHQGDTDLLWMDREHGNKRRGGAYRLLDPTAAVTKPYQVSVIPSSLRVLLFSQPIIPEGTGSQTGRARKKVGHIRHPNWHCVWDVSSITHLARLFLQRPTWACNWLRDFQIDYCSSCSGGRRSAGCNTCSVKLWFEYILIRFSLNLR